MSDDYLAIGDRVEVIAGNFKGHAGFLVDADEATTRYNAEIDPSDSPDDGLWLIALVFGRDVLIAQEAWRGMVRKIESPSTPRNF